MFKQRNVAGENGTTITTSSVFDNGAEMKIIFKVKDVRDASAIWFTNTGKYTAGSDTEVGNVCFHRPKNDYMSKLGQYYIKEYTE